MAATARVTSEEERAAAVGLATSEASEEGVLVAGKAVGVSATAVEPLEAARRAAAATES